MEEEVEWVEVDGAKSSSRGCSLGLKRWRWRLRGCSLRLRRWRWRLRGIV